MHAIKQILRAKTIIVHFFMVFIAALAACSLLYVFVIPVLYWMSFGEGAGSERIESLPVNIFIEDWGALIVVLAACAIGMCWQVNTDSYSRAKSFLLAGILLISIYLNLEGTVMDIKLFFLGTAFFIVGILMYFNVRKRKPASDKTNWNGQLMPQYIQFWMITILSIIVGLVYILESIFKTS